MDIHRNVYMWGQQEQINKMKLEGASLVMTRSMSGKTFFRYCLVVMLCEKIIIIFVLQYILLKSNNTSIIGSVSKAGSRSGSSILGIRNYFRMVSEHKDIVRSVMALQGMMFMYKPDIEKLLQVR